MERRDSKLKLYFRHVATAGTAMVAAHTVFAPLERAKLVLQNQFVSELSTLDQYKNLRHFLVSVPKREGVTAYWRGNTANVTKMLVGTGVKFLTHYKIYNLIVIDDERPKLELTIRQLTAGVLAGITTLFFVHPFDVCRTRMALDFAKKGDPRVYSGFLDHSGKTLRDNGIKGLYKGLLISFASVVPHCALSLTLNERLSGLMPQDSTFTEYFGVGSVSALITGVLLYPLDTVRRRMEYSSARGCRILYTNSLNCVNSILNKEGAAGFFKGLGVNVLRSVPSMALQLACYSWLKTKLA
mmetsp:Transcript_26466/g.47504  ORF Transcript_26466/g.47504 Transcript_26466/m.47504 type:complete len:298 (-) Transcript_26466:1689-2582(-)